MIEVYAQNTELVNKMATGEWTEKFGGLFQQYLKGLQYLQKAHFERVFHLNAKKNEHWVLYVLDIEMGYKK